MLGQFDEAIPVFQQVRQDPKYRTDAAILLGRAFLEAGFVDEAVDTLRGVDRRVLNKGDPKSQGDVLLVRPRRWSRRATRRRR